MRLSTVAAAGLLFLLSGCTLLGPVAEFEASATEGDLPFKVTFLDLTDSGVLAV